VLTMGQDLLHQRVPPVGRPPREQVVQRAAQAVDVGPVVGEPDVEGLLGGHEVEAPHHRADRRQSGRGRLLLADAERGPEPGQAQVEHLDRALGIPDQVGRLDIPVDEPLAVGMA